MTLRRQLTLIIAILFMLLVIGVFSIDIQHTRAYLNDQLNSISQDVSTSLGLTLSPWMAENNTTMIESHVSALYDSGYYHQIIVSDINGKTIFELSGSPSVEKVPKWFTGIFPLQTPQGTALVMNGWNQIGAVKVSVNPEFAYIRLWSGSVRLFWLFLCCFAAAFGLVMLVLHYVLRPLKAVQEQAEAISAKEYLIQKNLPWTRELREVVSAMNLMSTRIREMFTQQETALQHIRRQAYTDSVTGLPNRAYFNMRLQQMLEPDAGFAPGALLFIETARLMEINRKSGHRAGDALLKGIAQSIREKTAELAAHDALSARISGATFAIAISGVTEIQARQFAISLTEELSGLHEKQLTPFEEVCHTGLAFYRNQTFSEFLSETDSALRTAQIKGPNAIHYHSSLIGEFDTLTATQWIDLLNRTIENKNITLLKQTAMKAASPSEPMQHEVLLRISDGNRLIPASLFIPMIHHYGLATSLDKLIIATVIEQLAGQENKAEKIAVNLTAQSISDHEFVAWLTALLQAHPDEAKQLLFELDDYSAARSLPTLRIFRQIVAPYGVGLGIDHFGRNIIALSDLDGLKPDYLKIDGSLLSRIDENETNQRMLEILVNMAHSQDIRIIAESIETPQERETAIKLHMDGLQGYGLHRPEIWKKQ